MCENYVNLNSKVQLMYCIVITLISDGLIKNSWGIIIAEINITLKTVNFFILLIWEKPVKKLKQRYKNT